MSEETYDATGASTHQDASTGAGAPSVGGQSNPSSVTPQQYPIGADSLIEKTLVSYLAAAAGHPVPMNTMRDQVIEWINAAFDMENRLRKANDWPMKQIPKIEALPEFAVVTIILARCCIRVINFARGKGGSDVGQLALYDEDSGLYNTEESRIRRLASEISPSMSSRAIDSVIKRLQHEAKMVFLTREPNLSIFANGIFNRDQQELLPFSPDFVFLEKPEEVHYRKDAPEPEIVEPDGTRIWTPTESLRELAQDEEVYQFFWEMFLAVLLPHHSWDKIVCLYDPKGRSGKGTVLQICQDLIGEDAWVSIPLADFAKPFALSGLTHADRILTDENPVGVFNEDLSAVKALVTGDAVRLDRKYRDDLTMKWSGLMVQCLNGIPRARDKSASLLRRIQLVPFTMNFSEVEEKKYIKRDYFRRPEVLEFIASKALSMDTTEFSNPRASQELLAEYQEANNPVVGFWEEFRDQFVWDLLPRDFLYDLFRAWFDRSNPSGSMISQKVFISDLKELLETDDDWEFQKQARQADRMSIGEPLIRDYQLKDWATPGQKMMLDPNTSCVPPKKEKYRSAFLRVSGGDAA